MRGTIDLAKEGFFLGLKKGWQGFFWMMKLIIPISFGVMLLAASGLLEQAHFLLSPLMGLLSLPPQAALPLIIGMTAGIYSALAALVVLPFSLEEITLIAVFLLIAHSLIQEGIIQAKTGISPWKAVLFRLIAAVVTVVLIAPLLPGEPTPAAQAAAALPSIPFPSQLENWAKATFTLALKVFFIIIPVITLLEIVKKIGAINRILRLFSPILRLMGLNDRVGFIWVTAVIFGLIYGAAVIMEEISGGNLSKEETEALQISIGIQHAVIEDPILFISLGIGAFWIFVPRLIMAVLAVRLVQLYHRLVRAA